MEKISFNVKGMHCGSCEMLVKDALEEIDGIKNVKAAHKDSLVEVEYDGSKTDAIEIAKLIKKEGYEVE